MNESSAAGLISQLIRFALVGGFLTGLSAVVYWFPATFLGVPPIAANFLGYVAAVIAGWFLHGKVSFAGHGSRDNKGVRTFRFIIVSLISLALNTLFVWFLTGPMNGPTWWPVIPMFFVTPLVTFTLNRQWVFG
ncbi:GtrA family protein [Sphingosinicella sp. BN140058]|uniref:GtrA family protein n=1 Tax=Sphingosinicella sp. BN140058 TaxID=1892855 RepID=UPI001010DD77|nr:GtrA family protein [Sphingosinicella sp. BN140058]QAY77203.1 GtrA family protein [Sphingosinicella sp. BN140058]